MTSHSHTPSFLWPDPAGITRKLSSAERVGLGLLFAYVLAAFVGLIAGAGVPPPRPTSNAPTLDVQHRLLLRTNVEHRLSVRLSPELVQGPRVSLALERRYLEAMELKGTVPQTLATRFEGERLILDFALNERGEPPVIQLILRTLKAGAPAGEIGVVGGPSVHVRQFVSP